MQFMQAVIREYRTLSEEYEVALWEAGRKVITCTDIENN